ncbi:hypothetical protein [Stackebrandtia nassauensis]|uniref:Uncharacterized protein n=1 Tax=Stackebrandtia nassauensis (strain DSM 44728 / CIP 108903 / NRRL B-16338 / NBRC 102104 / LLR-40K-21) TaxID=446470 RepID=D3QC26_STANL|nr:hypothetical protein [Stackebrandtia nassauensis]ADD44915.1 hypothetical protein Snas_5281 [Stackebrandtia nassauensis DSM 44728]
MSDKRFSFDGVVFWGFLALMAGWATWGAVLYLPDAWFFVVFPSGFVLVGLLIWWKTYLLPWNQRIRSEIPRLAKIRVTLHYLAAWPWHRWRCHGTRATPLARFAALHYHPRGRRSAWYYGIPVEQLSGLFFDPNLRVRARLADSFSTAGITGDTLKLGEELPAETAADLARMLSMRTGHFHQAGNLTLAWRLWLVYGDEQLWQRLRQHNEAADEEPLRTIGKVALGRLPLAELLDSAVDPVVPRRARAKAAEHLKTEWNLPEDPMEAAPFFVLAGSMDLYRDIDPDGSLLTMAYAGMDAERRTRIRSALSDLGELDLVRQLRDVAGGRSRPGDDSPQRRFRACLAAPLLEAVELAGRLDGWQPEDSQDAALLNLLRRANIDMLRETRERVTVARQRGFELPRGTDRIGPASFSPDGNRLAVAVRVRNKGWRFREYAVGGGEVVGEAAAYPGGTVVSLVHTGSGFAALNRPHAGNLRKVGLTLTEDGRTRVIDESDFDGVATPRLWRRLRGFVRREGLEVAAYDENAEFVPSTRFGVHDIPGPRPTAGASNVAGMLGGRFKELSADPSLGRIAVLADRRLRVHDRITLQTLLVDDQLVDDDAVLFLDAKTIATVRDLPGQRFAVTRWQVGTSSITKAASAEHDNGPGLGAFGGRARLHRIAYGSRMLIVASTGTARSPGNDVMFTIDMSTLGRVHTPPQFDWRVLAASPDTRAFVGMVDSDDGLKLSLRSLAQHPLVTIVDTPMGELSPTDLRTVEWQLARCPEDEAPLTELLMQCLYHRFRGDIALGDAKARNVTEYDIHLGETT